MSPLLTGESLVAFHGSSNQEFVSVFPCDVVCDLTQQRCTEYHGLTWAITGRANNSQRQTELRLRCYSVVRGSKAACLFGTERSEVRILSPRPFAKRRNSAKRCPICDKDLMRTTVGGADPNFFWQIPLKTRIFRDFTRLL